MQSIVLKKTGRDGKFIPIYIFLAIILLNINEHKYLVFRWNFFSIPQFTNSLSCPVEKKISSIWVGCSLGQNPPFQAG